jgi:cytoskeletal protein CcmA (bactofilin family)
VSATVIGSELRIDGSLTSEEDVRIDGSVHGAVSSTAHVDLGPSGTVDAPLSARTVSVAGTVSSSITATERVDLLAGGRLIGDVKTPRLTIADGATFRGKVDMDV